MNLNLTEKIGQLFMVGFPGTELPEKVEKFITASNIGFVILFARNIESVEQSAILTNKIHKLGEIAPSIFTDQEGGTIVQFTEKASTVISHMGITATEEKENARTAGRIIGEEMDAIGIDGVFAPVLDVNFEIKNPVIGIRSFSDDPAMVVKFGREFAQGLRENNVLSCGKHFPGHGGTVEDSHQKIPLLHLEDKDFYQISLKPFKELSGGEVDAFMSAHVIYSNLSAKMATFSPLIVSDILRKRIGFKGVIFSDCLEMKAVKDNITAEQIVTESIAAGIDILSVSHSLDLQKELYEILFFKVSKGIISESRIDESLARINKLKTTFDLLDIRKERAPKIARSVVRRNRRIEEELAEKSITILKREQNVIPLNREEKILILEWEKVKATMPLSSAEKTSMLGSIAGEFLSDFELEILKLNHEIPLNVFAKINSYKYIIAAVYSRNPDLEKIQAAAVKKLLEIRDDIIVIALGNPYDILCYPEVKNYIATYGFREVQIKAFFRIVTGEIVPQGKLPVEIGSLFKRGFGISW